MQLKYVSPKFSLKISIVKKKTNNNNKKTLCNSHVNELRLFLFKIGTIYGKYIMPLSKTVVWKYFFFSVQKSILVLSVEFQYTLKQTLTKANKPTQRRLLFEFSLLCVLLLGIYGASKLHVLMPCMHAQSFRTLWTPWNVACQAPLSMGFSMQDYWSGLPFPPPGGSQISCISCIGRRILYHCTTWEV